MEHSFNSRFRKDILSKISEHSYDLLVIGGGITGAGIALDASLRGLSVLLVEKNDFASGTSNKSTKLIHGGLRYLKNLQLKVVAETGLERKYLYRNAPYLIRPEKMLLPVIKNGSLGKYSTRLALAVYDLLAGVNKNEKQQWLNKKKTQDAEPLLKNQDLIGSALYYEYHTDDARLCMQVLKTAFEQKAHLLNYVSFENCKKNDNVYQISLQDSITKKQYNTRAKCIINATGPWIDEVVNKTNKNNNLQRLIHSKGSHIVVDYDKFPLQHAVYYDTDDGRMVFAIPFQQTTYIGTTDKVFKADINQIEVEKTDIAYLIHSANHLFNIKISDSDVISAWAGVRPLIQQRGKKSTEISRKSEIFIEENGMISIAGGKLSAYRLMAEEAVDKAADYLTTHFRIKTKECETRTRKLIAFSDEKDASFNFFKYGCHSALISISSNIEANIQAELNYCLANECVLKLSDFVWRRALYLYYQPGLLKKHYKFIAKLLAEKLQWSEQELQENIKETEEIIQRFLVH